MEIAYFSGLFDGEWCIVLNKNNYGCYSLRLVIGMVYKETLFEIHKNFGGNLYFGKSNKNNKTPMNRWDCCGKIAGNILRLMLPYLREKKKQAELGLEFLEEFSGHYGRGNPRTDLEKQLQELYKLKMQLLKKKNKISCEEG